MKQVCTDYDVKEQIFRNFACAMDSFSELGVLHKWAPVTHSFLITFVWVDPNNEVVDSSEIKIGTNMTRYDSSQLYKPALLHPLKPGIWKLLLFFNATVLAETKFLIIPEVVKDIKTNEVDPFLLETHSLSGHLTSSPKIEVDTKSSALNSASTLENAQYSQTKILDLVSEFWTFNDICFHSRSTKHLFSNLFCNLNHINSCQVMEWSSFYYDAKSTL